MIDNDSLYIALTKSLVVCGFSLIGKSLNPRILFIKEDLPAFAKPYTQTIEDFTPYSPFGNYKEEVHLL